jgi:predicted transcriptional regulator
MLLRSLPVIARFWDKVDKTEDCWIWTGAQTSSGYGALSYKGTNFVSHRFSYELVHGPVDPNTYILHTCKTKLCVNPDHLVAYTYEERLWRYVEKTDTCWYWTGSKNPNGYGMFRGKAVHHIIYQMQVGECSVLKNTCGNVSCVNPDHWRLPRRVDILKEVLNRQGRTQAEIANSLQVSQVYVSEVMRSVHPYKKHKSRRPSLTEEERKKIKELRQEGHTQDSIASILGIYQSQVSKVLRDTSNGVSG